MYANCLILELSFYIFIDVFTESMVNMLLLELRLGYKCLVFLKPVVFEFLYKLKFFYMEQFSHFLFNKYLFISTNILPSRDTFLHI